MAQTQTYTLRVRRSIPTEIPLRNGAKVWVNSGNELPRNLAFNTRLYIPAHDFYKDIVDGHLVLDSTFGELTAFLDRKNMRETDISTAIQRIENILPQIDDLFADKLESDMEAYDRWLVFKEDMLKVICATNEHIIVLPLFPHINVEYPVFTMSQI